VQDFQGHLGACLVAVGLGIGIFHLYPWPKQLHRVLAYAIGTGTIWAGVYLYLGPSPLFWQLALFPLVVGGVTLVFKFAGVAQRWIILTAWPWARRQLISRLLRSDDARSE